MTIKIAICDDDGHIAFQVEEYLERLRQGLGIFVDTEAYYTGESLYAALEKGGHYDLIFLDIELDAQMVGMDGIQLGRKIRDGFDDVATQIVYISAKAEYALSLFQNNPLDFLLKPLDYESFTRVMGRFLKIAQFRSGTFTYSYGHDSFKLKAGDIMYLKSDGKKVEIHLKDGNTDFYYGSLEKAYREQLAKQDFLFIHRSHVVNYDHVSTFQYARLIMADGQSLPISQAKRMEVRKRHMEIEKRRA